MIHWWWLIFAFLAGIGFACALIHMGEGWFIPPNWK